MITVVVFTFIMYRVMYHPFILLFVVKNKTDDTSENAGKTFQTDMLKQK